MQQELIHELSYLGHKIEIIKELSNMPGVSAFEERLGISVRYGLKFNGKITDWSEPIEAFDNEEAALAMAKIGKKRAERLGQKQHG